MSQPSAPPSLASTPHIYPALPTPSWGLTTLQRSRISSPGQNRNVPHARVSLIFCGIIDSLGRLQRRAAAGVSSVYDFLLKISRHLDHASSLCKSDADFAWHSRCRSDAWNLWMQSDIGHSTCLTVSGCNRTLHLIHHYDHRVWWPPQTGRSCLLRGLCHADAGRQCKPEGVGRVTAQQLTSRSAATVRLESVSASSPNLSMTRRASMSRHACRLRRRPPPGLRRVKA